MLVSPSHIPHTVANIELSDHHLTARLVFLVVVLEVGIEVFIRVNGAWSPSLSLDLGVAVVNLGEGRFIDVLSGFHLVKFLLQTRETGLRGTGLDFELIGNRSDVDLDSERETWLQDRCLAVLT